ncbi:hypothetical protein SprV_0401559800 [Sparganum proliferum]
MNIVGKIFARIILNRLNNHPEQDLLPENQCSSRRHRGTTDMIFAVRQLQEKCQEMRLHLYSTFVGLKKAFDTVNHEGLWKIMQKFGFLERFTQMVPQLHDGMLARVTDNGVASEAFAVTNGVRQGCVLVLTLFSLMFSAILMDAYRDERPRTRIAYRTDGQLLNHRRIHFQSRVSTTTLLELLFAYDCAVNATTEGDIQRSMYLFSAACGNFGLIINTGKTVVMHQPPPNTAAAHNAPQISVNGTQLQAVDNFTYLDRTLTRSIKIDDGVTNCSTPSIPTVVSLLISLSPPTLSTNVDRPPEPPLPPSSSSSSTSSTASTSAAVAPAIPINTAHNPDTPTNINTTIVNNNAEKPVYTRPHCDRTFTSPIGLVGHLRIHRTETGESVSGALTYTRRIRLHCPRRPRTFTHRMRSPPPPVPLTLP